MESEIERKWLVINDDWKKEIIRSVKIEQTFIHESPNYHTRVRLITSGILQDYKQAFMTVKDNSESLERIECDMEIPVEYAEEILSRLEPHKIISKTRHWIRGRNTKFTIDEFKDKETLLEIEFQDLHSVDELDLPTWVGEEVTGNPKYYSINV